MAYKTHLQNKMELRAKVLEDKKYEAGLAKFNKAVKEGRTTSAEFWAHELNLSHDCDRERLQSEWNACLSDYDGDREDAVVAVLSFLNLAREFCHFRKECP